VGVGDAEARGKPEEVLVELAKSEPVLVIEGVPETLSAVLGVTEGVVEGAIGAGVASRGAGVGSAGKGVGVGSAGTGVGTDEGRAALGVACKRGVGVKKGAPPLGARLTVGRGKGV
jgi:hypothetical protein